MAPGPAVTGMVRGKKALSIMQVRISSCSESVIRGSLLSMCQAEWKSSRPPAMATTGMEIPSSFRRPPPTSSSPPRKKKV